MEDTYQVIRKHKWKIVLSFAAALFFLFVIAIVVGLGDILNVLSNANWYFILLNFVLEFVILLIWTLRWKLILGVMDESASFKSLLVMLFASIFGNNVTAGAAGGEPLRAYLLRELEGTPFETGLASSTADRVFEFLPFVLISIFAAVLILSWDIGLWTRLIVFVLIILSMIFFGILLYAIFKREVTQRVVISMAKSVYPFFIRLTKKTISFADVTEKLIFYINRFSSGFLQVIKDRKIFLVGFILSFVMWTVDMARIYVCFVALGTYPPVMPLIIIYTIAILISLVPLLPGSWGIREATMVALFAVVGVPGDVVIAASLIDRLASYIVPTFIGAFAAFYYGKHIRDNKKTVLP
jgi:glycosyltransferase 2 family protein